MNKIGQFIGKKNLIHFLWIFLLSSNGAFTDENRSSQEGYLGVVINMLSEEKKEELGVSYGVLVIRVVKDEPADVGGILENDVILVFNGMEIQDPDHLTEIVRETKPETEVKITLLRDSVRKEVGVKVGQLPTSRYGYGWSIEDNRFRLFDGGGGYLGVTLEDMNEDLASYFGVKEDEGVLILNVEEDSPADSAGLKSGDLIVTLNGRTVSNPGEIQDIFTDLEKGDEVEIEIIRHQQKQQLTVRLGENPQRSVIRIFPKLDDSNLLEQMKLKDPFFPRLYMPELNIEIHLDDLKSKIEENLKNLENLNEKLQQEFDHYMEII